MTDPRITKALSKLDHGGWSLTVTGFACRALGFRPPYTETQKRQARDAMMASGLPHRRTQYGIIIDCWDYDAP
jgi:hypothetical protein